MTIKKRGIDHRQEGGITRSNRVDRVFIPNNPAAPRPPAQQIAAELLATSRTQTTETAATGVAPGNDTELSLRRQLSRLQRQLAESQQELANKDEELAAEVERRLETVRWLEQAHEQQRAMQAQVDELLAYQARTAGVEQRLQDAITANDELNELNQRERAAAVAAQARVDELNISFEETRSLWNAERKMLEERYANELAALDAQRKTAVEASAEALNAQAAKLRETHEAELAALRDGYEQSLATLREDLGPKEAQLHSLLEERERMLAEVAAVRAEAMRDIVELEAEHKVEMQQAAELHASEVATLQRNHATELARLVAERDLQHLGFQQQIKSNETRALVAEEQLEVTRETLKNAQRRALELDEKIAALEADKKSKDEALDRARAQIAALEDDKRKLQAELEASAAEIRRGEKERHRFVAYLEEGLALLGALPPKPESPEIEQIIELEADALDES